MKSVNVREDREVVHLSDGLECLCPIVGSIFLDVLQHYKQLWFVMTVGHSVITMWLHCDNIGTLWLQCDYSGTHCDYSRTPCDYIVITVGHGVITVGHSVIITVCQMRVHNETFHVCCWFNLYFINCKFKTILLYIKIMAKFITFVVYQVTSPHTMLHYDKMLLHISQSA